MWVDENVHRVINVPCQRCGIIEAKHVFLLQAYYTSLCDNCRTEFDIRTQNIGLVKDLIIKTTILSGTTNDNLKQEIITWLFDHRIDFINISSSFVTGINGFPPPKNRFINTN